MSRLLALMLTLACLPLAAVAGDAGKAGAIDWRPWSSETFAAAKAADKLIFIEVGTEWCTACNTMAATSYQDPRVHKQLAEHYVAISVDAEAETDVGERYGFWGWPALVFMTPAGEHVHFVRGAMRPDDFVWLLGLLRDRRQKGELQPVGFDVNLRAEPFDGPLDAIVQNARAQIDSLYDTEFGGWGRARMPDHTLVQQALWRAGTTTQPEWRDRVLHTAAGMRTIMDPVWGGVFFGGAGPNWSRQIRERRTEHQASAISVFAAAYRLSRDPAYLHDAAEVVRFLDGHFRTPAGLYVTSQEENLVGVDPVPDSADYFRLDDAGRRQLGLPPIDRMVYADINAKVALAFADLYEAGGVAVHRERALAIGEALRAARRNDGLLPQLLVAPANEQRMRVLVEDVNRHAYLRSQAFAGNAFLALYSITADPVWLADAAALAEGMHARLWYEPAAADGSDGGPAFLASDRRVTLPNGSVAADRPLVDNAAAADFLLRLAAYQKGSAADKTVTRWHGWAETALRSVSAPNFVRENDVFIGGYTLAVHALRDEFIEATVVCADPAADACRALWRAALHDAPHVRRLVKVQAPGRYPDMGEPAAFVCTSRLCSEPILASQPQAAAEMTAFMQRLDELTRDTSR